MAALKNQPDLDDVVLSVAQNSENNIIITSTEFIGGRCVVECLGIRTSIYLVVTTSCEKKVAKGSFRLFRQLKFCHCQKLFRNMIYDVCCQTVTIDEIRRHCTVAAAPGHTTVTGSVLELLTNGVNAAVV